jgi:hypothetical protein
MSESDTFKNLDDFVLLHYASRYNWKNILETGELRSSYYSGKLSAIGITKNDFL